MNEILALAQNTIREYLNTGKVLDADNVPDPLKNQKAGCFVSLHDKKSNELRGCIGTVIPSCKNLAAEIIGNAISACHDPRFTEVSKKELADLDISVDILSEPEPIPSPKSLNPQKYGCIVRSKDGRSGLLLPDIPGVTDIDYQIAIAKEKAGILPDEPIFLYRFTVDRYKE